MTITLTLFTASWCGACKALAPRLQVLSNELGVALHIHDVEQHDTPPEVRGLPVVRIEHNGEVNYMPQPTIDAIKTAVKEYRG